MTAFTHKIKSIITGWYRFLFEKRSEIGRHRLEICKQCELRKGFVCGECGCVLAAKVEVEDEECPVGKWQTKTPEALRQTLQGL